MVNSKKYFYFCNSFANIMDPGILLHTIGLSKTRNRVNILKILEKAARPLSGKEICTGLYEKCDKSTVHRTLNSLFQKKVVQRVIIDHEVKYVLKRFHQNENGDKNDHIHFKCSRCGRLVCMTEIEVKDYRLPAGFVKEENQFLVIGKCDKCQ
ncbi:MAG: transcriptional repressor [Bacteroidales bacterium]